MPVRAIATVMRVALEGRMTVGNTDLIVNTFYWSRDPAEPAYEEDLDALYDELNDGGTSFIENYLDVMPTTYTLLWTRISQATFQDPLTKVYAQGNTGNRVVEGERAPSYVAALLGWRATSLGGRRGKAKTFIGGLYEQDIAGDNLASLSNINAAISAFQAGTAKYQAGSVISNWRLMILSNPDKILPYEPAPVGKRPVEAHEVNMTTGSTQLAIQSRRKVGRGA